TPNVRGALVAPGAIGPVLKPPPSCVAVWTTLSALRQRALCPPATLAGLGEKELAPDIPLIVIVTTVAGEAMGVGMGVGVGKGVGVGNGVGVGDGGGVGK